MAGSNYYLLDSNGWISRSLGLDLKFWNVPVYAFAAMLLAADLTRILVQRPWASATAVVVSQLGQALVAAAAIAGLSPLVHEMAAHPRYESGLALLPYFEHLARLGPWLFILLLLLIIHQAARPWLAAHVPAPGPVPRHYTPKELPRTLRASGLLAGSTFLFLHSEGFIWAWTGANLGYLQAPLYVWALASVLSTVVATFGRGLWRYSGSVIIKGAAWAYTGFVLLAGSPLLLERLGPGGAFLRAYLLPLAPLSPWLTAYTTLVTIYYASAVYWNRDKYSWLYSRIGERVAEPVRSLNRSVLLALATYLLLSPANYLNLWLGLDFSFLSTSVYILAGALLAARLAVKLGRGTCPVGTSRLIAWFGWLQLVYVLLHALPQIGTLLVNTPAYSRVGEVALPYLAVIGHLDFWAASFLGLVAIYHSTAEFWKRPQYQSFAPMLRASMMLLLGGMSWGALNTLSPIGQITPGLGAVAFSAFAAVSMACLARYTTSHPHLVVSHMSRWLAVSHFRSANLGGFVALYAIFLRPALYSTFIYAPLLEAAGIFAICLYVIRRPWAMLSAQAAAPSYTESRSSWQRHKQVISPVPDETFGQVSALQQAFLTRGERPAMIARLVTASLDNEIPLRQIAQAIAPIVQYPDAPRGRVMLLVSFILPGSRSRFQTQMIEGRRQAHHDLNAALGNLESSWTGSRRRFTELDPSDGAWRWAREAFVQQTSKAELIALLIRESWQRNASRNTASRLVFDVLQYQDARPFWYRLPQTRQHLAEVNLRQRQEWVTNLQSRIISPPPSPVTQPGSVTLREARL